MFVLPPSSRAHRGLTRASSDESPKRPLSVNAINSTGEIMASVDLEPAHIGSVRDVSGHEATCFLDLATLTDLREQEVHGLLTAATVGGLVKVGVDDNWVIGSIARVQTSREDAASIIADISLIGEAKCTSTGGIDSFRKGVSLYPRPNDNIYLTTRADFDSIFVPEREPHIQVGTVYPTKDVRACLLYDRLLSRHFAVLGSTGTGKSSMVALMLHRLRAAAPHGHIVILDPHGEYAAAFGSAATIFTVDSLQIPYWAMNLEEHCEAFIPRNEESREVAVNVLAKCLLAARARNEVDPQVKNLTADSPIPYRYDDLIDELEAEAGRLQKQAAIEVYTRLKLNVVQKFSDPRFRFIFDHHFRRNSLETFLRQIMRIPANGNPIAILDLSHAPSEIVSVIVAIVSRLVFNYAVLTPAALRSPVLLVCEEAQRYLPASGQTSAASAERNLEQIAREGRKYGVALGLVTQRPSELSATGLSQCGTIISFRLSNALDQAQVRAALPDGSGGLVDAIPALLARECIIFGEGTRVPMRVRVDDLEQASRPASQDPIFSARWNDSEKGQADVAAVLHRWRGD